ncbi:MAG: hypothetical protein JXL80_07050 [Planctomycetes bacterium]|nr:hypothetical protein [Planctomycetota bacterium]
MNRRPGEVRAASQESLDELALNIDGLVQLASWQLAMAREVKSKVTMLLCSPGAAPEADQRAAPSPRRRKRT